MYPHCRRLLSTQTELLSLINTSSSPRTTSSLHSLSLLLGLLPRSITLSSALLLRYASLRSHPDTLLSLFRHSLPFSPESTFLHNTLIRAYSLAQHYTHGLRVYNDMIKNGVVLDAHTYPFAVRACGGCMDASKGREVHGRVVKVGFAGNLYVGNTLMLFYGSVEELGLVEKVFGEMLERDVISWNTMIKVGGVSGLWWFREMVSNSGFGVNVATVVSVLPVVAGVGDEEMASGVHCFVLKLGLDCSVNVCNALVDVYGKCGNVEVSRRVFDEIVERNDVSWNAMITSFSCLGVMKRRWIA